MKYLDEKYNVPVYAWCKNKRHGFREWHFNNVSEACCLLGFGGYKNMKHTKMMDLILKAMETGKDISNRHFALDTKE